MESFREMLHISPRVPGQSFAELPFEEEILEFLRTMATTIEQQVALDETLVPSTKRLRIGRSNFRLPSDIQSKESTLQVVYDVLKNIVDLEAFREILHISPTVPGQSFAELPFEEEILEFLRNTKAYKEYYACATGEAAPKPKASARRKRGGSDSFTTPPTAIASPRPITTVAAASRLTAAAKRKQPARATNNDDDDDDDDEEEIAKLDEQEDTETGEGDAEETESDGESEEEETREEEEESFDPIPRTPEDDEDDGNGKEDQGLRISEEERIQEEEEVDELYRDADINQGRGLQVSQDIEDSHVTLTPVHPDGQHESSSVSSFVTSMLNPTSDAGTQSRQMSASESAFTEEPVQTTCQMDEPPHPVFEIGAEDQPIIQTSQHPEWFSQPRKPPTPDRDWNKTLPAIQGSAQTWISELAKQADSLSSFNELLDTPIDFSNFIMNRLGVDTLTPELLAGPTYELIRGSCNSLTELEYHLEEVYKVTTDQLDWVNPDGQYDVWKIFNWESKATRRGST
nr:hypothetical protein [Tanacetum cinerariifolium]